VRSGVLSKIKRLVVPTGVAVRAIRGGPFRGLKMNLDLASQTQVYLGLFEREVYTQLRTLSAGVATAIDIGAAYGEYTLYFLSRTTARKILAFEPADDVRVRLLANLELNHVAHDRRLEISAKFVGRENNDSCCSLDALLSVVPPCFIKMDIDGGEVAVLEGAGRLLRSIDSRWLIETHSPQLEQNCISILSRAGYQTHVIRNAWWRLFLPEQRPSEHNRWLIAGKRPDVRL